MKLTSFVLFSFILFSVQAHVWAPLAYGVGLNGTNSTNATNDPIVVNGQQQRPKNEVTSNYMPQQQTQQKAEENTRDLNKQGQKQSNAAGMAAIAAGMAMIAAGVALNATPCVCGGPLIAAGVALVAAGMAALAAGKKAGQNANDAQGLNKNLSNIATPPLDSYSGASADSIKVDPSFLNHPKMDNIMKELEERTGITKDDFAKGIEGGMSPQEMLANAPKKVGSAAEINAAFEKHANDPMPTNSEIMDKLGLTQSDIAEMTETNLAGDTATKPGAGAPSLESLFGAPPAPDAGNGVARFPASNKDLSPDVQAALDKNGITGRTIFEMVHTQYKKKTPMMFGVAERKPGETETNAFSNLGGGVEL